MHIKISPLLLLVGLVSNSALGIVQWGYLLVVYLLE